MQPQSSPKDSSSSNPSPATTPQIPVTPTDQLDQGQTIIVQQSGPNSQQIHLIGTQQQAPQQQQQQSNVVLPIVTSSAAPTQQQPSQHQIIEVPGNSSSSNNLVENNNNNGNNTTAPIRENSNASNTPQNSTLSPQLHLTDSQNINISASQILDNKSPINDCSETNTIISRSSNNNNLVIGSTSESPSNNNNNSNSSESLKGPNISVAANIANTFINISSNQSTGKASGSNQNVNVIAVSQQPLTTQHFMKTLTINTSRGNIFVPNVIATNLAGAPQFTVHHHQYGLHTNSSGPAPNVTVNPNGNFATNSNAMIRPHAYQTTQFRPFLTTNQSNPNVIQSPILAASLQTINKIATNQSKSIGQVTIIQTQSNAPSDNKSPNKSLDETGRTTPNTPTRALTPQSVVDQQIRVLTPSEIMRTLPSLSTQDATLQQQQQTIINTNSKINSQNVNNSSSNNNSNSSDNIKSQAIIATSTNHSTSSSNNNVVCSSTTTIVTTCISTSTTVTTQNAQTINDKQITVRIDTKRKKIHVIFFSKFFPYIFVTRFI